VRNSDRASSRAAGFRRKTAFHALNELSRRAFVVVDEMAADIVGDCRAYEENSKSFQKSK
jgi:hypothetical protein